jgi:hypothetical protein
MIKWESAELHDTLFSILIDFAVGNKRIVPLRKGEAAPSETETALLQPI